MNLHSPRKITADDLKKIHEIVAKNAPGSVEQMSHEEELCRLWYIKGWEMAHLYGPHAEVHVLLDASINRAKELGSQSHFLAKPELVREVPPTPKFNYEFREIDD